MTGTPKALYSTQISLTKQVNTMYTYKKYNRNIIVYNKQKDTLLYTNWRIIKLMAKQSGAQIDSMYEGEYNQ